MNGTRYGVITTAPDALGFGVVTFRDGAHRVFFQPERFLLPAVATAQWFVPVVGDTVAVSTGTPQWVCLWVIKRGTPTSTYAGGG